MNIFRIGLAALCPALMLAQNDISADKLSRNQLISALGLDKPMWEQYASWIGAWPVRSVSREVLDAGAKLALVC